MKVTFTTFDSVDYIGGPNSWLRRVVPRLRDSGWDVEVLFYIQRGPPEECPCYRALSDIGIPCKAMPSFKPIFEQAVWLLKELEKSPPSVFVVNMAIVGYLATRWIRRAGIPSIGILHSDDDMYRMIFDDFVIGPPGNRLSDVVCVSDFLLQDAQGAETDTALHLIPYGVPIPDQAVNASRDDLRLIYVGRLIEEQKQILEVTRSLCRAVREVPGTEAVIYGDGQDRAGVEQIIASENLGGKVRLGGEINNDHIQDVMLEADALVLLSDYEGLPIALLEGMACGLVPICLRIRSGVGQLIEQGKTGFLVDDRGDDFITAVRTAAADRELRSRISAAARELIVSKYSNDMNAKLWIELLASRAQEAPHAEVAAANLRRGIRSLEFLEKTVAESNERMQQAQ
ncbi:MAG: glycosyltransferase family 4 protein [Novosphingobium sp.]